MSVAQAQQLVGMLNEIMTYFQGIDNLSTKIQADTPKIQESDVSLRRQVKTLNLMMADFQYFTGNDTLDAGVDKMQQMLMIGMRLYLLFDAINMAAGPWGWAYAVANGVAVGISISNIGQ